jgi:hypothetical protein
MGPSVPAPTAGAVHSWPTGQSWLLQESCRRGSLWLAVSCLTATLSACTGEIGSQEPHRPGSATGQPGDPGTLDTDGDGVPDALDADGDGLPDSDTDPTMPDEPSVAPTDVGTVTIHRLNNTEYNNTVRDLLGTSSTPADEFPLDGSGAGFDNLASVLTLSAPHLVAMQAAAEELAATAMQESAQRSRIVTCDLAGDAACAKTSLLNFVKRAWRRPVTEAELSRYYGAIDDAIATGDTAEQALTTVLEAVLLSPHFLFRAEIDPDPRSTAARPLSGHELASRLSYFLWSSMPDDALFSAASAGTLPNADTLSIEVMRMLQDPKSQALVENFAGQWLYLRKVDEISPDAELFPSFDQSLRDAMKQETELLFADVVFNGAPIDQLLLADYSYTNARLAQHYGVTAPVGNGLSRVDLSDNAQRPGGILSHGSVLTVTSHAARTSPVLRGKWVMSQLLCTEIDPPPPDVDTSLDSGAVTASSLREQLEQHRSVAVCATCHDLMDPIGLGLENFDAIGAYRTSDNGTPIDSSGTLPDGSVFAGAADLRNLIAADPGFVACLVKNLYTYALGRVPEVAPEHYDVSTLAALRENLTSSKSFAGLVAGIVQSAPFVQRRGDPTEAGQ